MWKRSKSKSLMEQIDYLRALSPTLERNLLISKLRYEMEKKDEQRIKFNYVKHHMNIDMYEIIWKDLYWHMSRLIDTMNENSVVDLDMLAVGRTMKYNIKKDLIAHWVLKAFRKDERSSLKLYMNPLFWLKNRVYPGEKLKSEFKDINKKIYNITL